MMGRPMNSIPVPQSNRKYAILYLFRERFAAYGAGADGEKSKGPSINVASTLHVVPAKYDQIF